MWERGRVEVRADTNLYTQPALDVKLVVVVYTLKIQRRWLHQSAYRKHPRCFAFRKQAIKQATQVYFVKCEQTLNCVYVNYIYLSCCLSIASFTSFSVAEETSTCSQTLISSNNHAFHTKPIKFSIKILNKHDFDSKALVFYFISFFFCSPCNYLFSLQS